MRERERENNEQTHNRAEELLDGGGDGGEGAADGECVLGLGGGRERDGSNLSEAAEAVDQQTRDLDQLHAERRQNRRLKDVPERNPRDKCLECCNGNRHQLLGWALGIPWCVLFKQIRAELKDFGEICTVLRF